MLKAHRRVQRQLITMNYQSLIEQIKRHEGLRLTPYKCTAGKLTIGYGRNLEDRGISKSEAEDMLLADVAEVEERLHKFGLLGVDNDARRSVLINMAFQLGVSGLMKFKRFIAAYRAGDFVTASKEMLDSRWAMQTPNRAKELSEQMLTGEWF